MPHSPHSLLARAAEIYKRALIGHQPGLTWDYLVLTAANEHQAAGYRHELALRSNPAGPLGAFFPPSQQTLVVPDPPGFRAGSGGATLHVLRAIAAHQQSLSGKAKPSPKPFDSLRILLIHSGGASQRLPLYSALGKIFTPLPLVRPDGQLMTLFDHLYLLLATIPPRLAPGCGGMLTAAGDVFLLFDASTMPPPAQGISALSIRTPAAYGQAHGIFRVEPEQAQALRHKGTKGIEKNALTASVPSEHAFPLVQTTLQKATLDQMRSAGFTDAQDRVLIDSGLLFFDAAATTALYHLSRKYTPEWHAKTRQQIDLYADIAPAALVHQQPELTADPIKRKLQSDLRAALEKSPLRCYELPAGSFHHIGTSRQYRDALTGLDPAPACTLFHRNVRFSSDSPLPVNARTFQSVITTKGAQIGPNAVLENCLLAAPISIGAGSILSNFSLPPDSPHAGLAIPPETLLYTVPIRAGTRTDPQSLAVTLILGIHDDPKTDRTFCNIDLRHWLTLAGLTPNDLWPKSEKNRILWTARLFPAGGAIKNPKARTQHPEAPFWFPQPATLTPEGRAAWRGARRYSLADLLEAVDAGALATHRDALSGLLQATQWIDAVEARTASSVQNTINHFGKEGYQRLLDTLHAATNGHAPLPPLTRARLLWSLAEIQSRPLLPRESIKLPAPTPVLQKRAFDSIRDAMSPPELTHQKSKIKHQQSITASAPVRLDFSGGWTDTPPYCLENGGAVLNVAIDLNDVEPIQTTFQPLEEPVIRLVSRDLGKTLLITTPERLQKPLEPGDPFALHLAALRLTGLAPGARESSMKRYLARLTRAGRGFELATASNLPKGSGMGTSSILGATTLAVLRAAAGLDTAPSTLFEQTLLLEQHLGTGGGWQDQVGGIVGGAKIATTTPGIPQRLKVRKIPLSPGQKRGLEDRLVVYFTGQQRLARNILREVMGRYLSREPGTMVLFNELTTSALNCESALRKSDWLAVAAEINHYWRIKKDLFPGSTTPAVDALFLDLRPYYLAGCLAGAGGGGFAYFLCRDPDQAHRLRTELARLSTRPGSLGLTFAAAINVSGLHVRQESER